MGGWDRVVVLGWNFEPSIGETITALNDSRLEVLVIPPDLMDRLKKKGGIDKLRGQDDANRVKLQAVINQEPLALIEYWAVDPDYDGRVFRSVWQHYRGNTANDADALRVVTQAVVTTSTKPGPRKVCVRAVDVFGFEAEVVSII